MLGVIFLAGTVYFLKKKRHDLPVPTESDLFSMGQISASKNNHAQAAIYFKKLLEKDPRHSIAARFLLESQMRLNEKNQIIETIDLLLKMDPSESNLKLAASAYFQIGEKNRGEDLLKKITSIQK